MAYLLLLLSSLAASSLLLSFLLARRRVKAGLPPGRLGPPLVGETLQLVSAYKTENPEPFIDERVWRHGRVFTTHVFGETTVFSTDPELNRQVLQGEGRVFECSYPSSISTLLGRHSLLLMKGALHRRMHTLTIQRFASTAALRDSLLPDIDRLVRLNLNSWAGRRIRLLDQAKKITFELTMKQLMSVDPGEWTESLRKEYLLVIEGFFSLPLYLPFTTYGRALQARTKVAEALKLVVRERKRAGAATAGAGEEGTEKNKAKDMLDALLEAEEGLSEEEVVDFMLALLVAGYETTSTIMTLAAKLLEENPRVLAVLKEEQEGIRARKRDEADTLEWNDYKAMPFTQCVINETLRVANIISGVFRRAVSDVEVKGYTIPKGCKVFASFRAVHLDPKYFEDARSFNPWRWQQKNSASAVQPVAGGAGVFMPFGGGPRLCPGYELARVEISVFLHHLVTGFSWEAAEQDRLVFFPTTRTQKGYPINVRRRTEV